MAKSRITTTNTDIDYWDSYIGGYIYHNNNTGDALTTQISDGRKMHFTSLLWLWLDPGTLAVQTLVQTPIDTNGYSAGNLAVVQANTNEQYALFSEAFGIPSALDNMCASAVARTNAVTYMVNFVTTNNLTGIDLNCEQSFNLNAVRYNNFKLFVQQLTTALHAVGKKIIITQAGFFFEQPIWNEEDLVTTIGVDYYNIMLYDYHWYGANNNPNNTPLMSDEYAIESVYWTQAKMGANAHKLMAAIPNYGYYANQNATQANIGSSQVSNIHLNTMSTLPGFGTSTRPAVLINGTNIYRDTYGSTISPSWERHWVNGGRAYWYQDSTSMNHKRRLLESLNVKHIIVWHLGGGNPWFSIKKERAFGSITGNII